MTDPRSLTAIADSFSTLLPRPTVRPRAHPSGTHALRGRAFHILKFPLLRRYAVRWHWPRAVDLASWDRISFESGSGAKLAGLYGSAKTESKGVVVCAHPLRREAKAYFMRTGRADMLRRNGYDVLLFDFNGFGESSQGDFNYVEDVLAAGDYARRRAGLLPVHALGACFGAVWTLCAATRKHPFVGIAVEAPLTSLREYYRSDPAARAFLGLLWRLFPRSAANATPIHAAARLVGDIRLLMIGGLEDAIAPIAMCRQLFEACNLPLAARAVWYAEGAGHLRAFETAPHGYEERLSRFFAHAALSLESSC